MFQINARSKYQLLCTFQIDVRFRTATYDGQDIRVVFATLLVSTVSFDLNQEVSLYTRFQFTRMFASYLRLIKVLKY